MLDTIGVDVSKDRLDAFAHGPGSHRGFANDRTGRRALLRWARSLGCDLVVFEPTGRYHRQLARDLAGAGQAYVAVDPLQARRFTEAEGRRDGPVPDPIGEPTGRTRSRWPGWARCSSLRQMSPGPKS